VAKHTTKTKETKDIVFTHREAKGWADWETHDWLRRLITDAHGEILLFGILCWGMAALGWFEHWGTRGWLSLAGALVLVGLWTICRSVYRAIQVLAECVRLLGLIHKPESEENIVDLRRRLPGELQSLWALERVAAWHALPSDRSFTRSEAESIVRAHLPTEPYVNWWKDLERLGGVAKEGDKWRKAANFPSPISAPPEPTYQSD
jgi:hypothetical protein